MSKNILANFLGGFLMCQTKKLKNIVRQELLLSQHSPRLRYQQYLKYGYWYGPAMATLQYMYFE
jgi:hypothetical protein